MPATEQTWRSLKTLHVVFGASALAVLLTTVWMFAADHNREAKGLQKQFNAVETRTLEWRKTEQLTAKFEEEKKLLDDKLKTERAKLPPREVVDNFVKIAESKPDNGYNVAAVKKAYEDFAAAVADAARSLDEKGKLHDKLIDAMQQVVDRAAYLEKEAQSKLKFTKANLDVDMSVLAIEIDENKPPKKIEATQEKVNEVRTKVDNDLTVAFQDAKTHRTELLTGLTAVKSGEDEVRKEIDKQAGDVRRTETAIYEKAPNAGKWLLEMPILDAFGGWTGAASSRYSTPMEFSYEMRARRPPACGP